MVAIELFREARMAQINTESADIEPIDAKRFVMASCSRFAAVAERATREEKYDFLV